jgi:hypothetical protein
VTSAPLFGRDGVLSIVLVLIVLALPGRMLPVRVEPVLELVLSKNRTPVTHLHQRRSVEQKRTVWVERLDLAHGGRLAHPRLGEIGFGQHFFLDLAAHIEVRHAGEYRFVVTSDDGFALYLGDRELCAHTGDRALSTQTCTATLSAGEQRLRLRYFQGGGPAGLSVQYGRAGSGRLHWLGEDSRDLTFRR